MANGFSVPALGKGSIASFVRIALDIAWVVLWIVAIVLAVASVVYVVMLVMVHSGALSQASLQGQSTTSIGPVTIHADGSDRMFAPILAPALFAGTVAVGGGLVIIFRLKRLFANFTSGEPFSRDNAGHLRAIWITMLVMELSRYVIAAAVAVLVAIFGQPETTQINVEAPVNLTTWGSILILIVLAEVFREGARLKEEQELTI